jgi:HK97 family phage prohead protease
LEVREQKNGEKKLSGYAVVFNSPADIGGDFTEIVAPGAFTRTLKEDDQVMLRDHRSELLLGRVSAGTLRLSQDRIGLAFEVSPLPKTEVGLDTYENVRLKNLKGCSFGFYVRDDTWTQDSAGKLTRILNDIQLAEVTLTAFPAYDSTSVDVRSVRAKRLAKSKNVLDLDDDPDNGDDDSGDDCNCDCLACGDGRCEDCTDPECDDDNCLGCANQERAAHMDLILRRFRA